MHVGGVTRKCSDSKKLSAATSPKGNLTMKMSQIDINIMKGVYQKEIIATAKVVVIDKINALSSIELDTLKKLIDFQTAIYNANLIEKIICDKAEVCIVFKNKMVAYNFYRNQALIPVFSEIKNGNNGLCFIFPRNELSAYLTYKKFTDVLEKFDSYPKTLNHMHLTALEYIENLIEEIINDSASEFVLIEEKRNKSQEITDFSNSFQTLRLKLFAYPNSRRAILRNESNFIDLVEKLTNKLKQYDISFSNFGKSNESSSIPYNNIVFYIDLDLNKLEQLGKKFMLPLEKPEMSANPPVPTKRKSNEFSMEAIRKERIEILKGEIKRHEEQLTLIKNKLKDLKCPITLHYAEEPVEICNRVYEKEALVKWLKYSQKKKLFIYLPVGEKEIEISSTLKEISNSTLTLSKKQENQTNIKELKNARKQCKEKIKTLKERLATSSKASKISTQNIFPKKKSMQNGSVQNDAIFESNNSENACGNSPR